MMNRGPIGAAPLLAFSASAGLLLALAVLAPGCGRVRDERTADGRLIVHYWEKWTGFEGEAMQAVVDDFNASQNRLFVQVLTVSQINRKMLMAAAGGNPPDVAGIWSSDVTDYAEKGALTPLNRMLDRAGISRTNYIPVFWDLCSHRGFVWALPSTPASVALHWNRKMFRDAGLDPDRPPHTLDELDAMGEQLTVVEIEREGKPARVRFSELTAAEKAAHRFKLLEVGHLPQEPGWWSTLWVYWFGGDLWDGDRRITATSPESVEALRWYGKHAEKYGVDNLRSFGASFGNFSSPQNPFLSGRVAMEIQGVWMYNFIDKYAPHLEWGVAPFPAKDPARFPLVTIAESDVLVIPKGARHPKEAFDFIRYACSQGPAEKLALGQRKFTPLADVNPGFIEKHPNPYIKTFIDLAKSPQARTTPRMSIWTEYGDELGVAITRVMSLKATPEETLAQVQERVQWKFDRTLRRWDAVKDDRLKEWSEYDAR